MSNLLIQQYGKYKRQHLDENPFSCLLDTSIDINPHQVDAFCAAVKSLKTGGIILADEVGLGKTIEAGLVIKYVIKTGAKKILISLPASLRKQWEVELLEKFDFDSESIKILDRQAINYDPVGIEDHWLKDSNKVSIALTSYDFSSKLMKKYPNVKWDFVVIDEAHNMWGEIIHSVTVGHPQLVQLAVNYVSSDEFSPTDEKIANLFTFSGEVSIADRCRTALGRMVSNIDALDLLNRLLLFDGLFTEKDCRTIAEVEPAIRVPMTLLSSLLGPWVQKNEDKYQVFPLLKKALKPDLNAYVNRDCCDRIADII